MGVAPWPSVFCTGSASSRCYQAGAKYGNGEFIQVHPTAIPGSDKLRLMVSPLEVRVGGLGTKTPQDVRTPRDIPEGERYYFLEGKIPGIWKPRPWGYRDAWDLRHLRQ